jgi:site-specific DNA-methyltransferase (adenine-specific)/adenine-specific DNA-methyltransferase
MPNLTWTGKDAVVRHHLDVPFRLLKADPKLSCGNPESGNFIVQGDNLVSLKAILPYYAGAVKCIYIDPPYNTGEQTWTYNDAVNSPEIRDWLGKTVGKEAEDLCRHDKWLCMMYPRLRLLKDFLRDDGVIFVSIDDAEVRHLRLVMDEIFGPRNALGTLVWKRRSSSAMRGMPLSVDHEYILVYAKDAQEVVLHGLGRDVEDYPFEDSEGQYASTDLTVGMTKQDRPNQFYDLINPRTGKSFPANPGRVWRFIPETMARVIADNLIIWPDEVDGDLERPRYKTRFNPDKLRPRPVSSWIENSNTNDREIEEEETEYDLTILTSGLNSEGGKLLQQIMGRKIFTYPKPLSLIRSLLRSTTRGTDIVLDSFAGTGTTAHAALSLNVEDGGQRRFILNELDAEICSTITGERVRRVIEGYEYQGQKGPRRKVAGLGGAFQFCTLGPEMFTERGQITEHVSFDDLARHLFFVETGTALAKPKSKCPLMGVHGGTGYYLLFNGVLGDRRPDGGNVLTGKILDAIPPHNGPKVIYGEGCRLSPSRLQREGILFKQIPYQIRTR